MQAVFKRSQTDTNADNEFQKQQIEATMKTQIVQIEAMERKEAEAHLKKEKEKN